MQASMHSPLARTYGVRVRQPSPSRLIRYGAIPRCSSTHSQCTRDARSHTRRIMRDSRNNATRARQYVAPTERWRSGMNIGKHVQFRSDGLIDTLKRSPVDLFGTLSLSSRQIRPGNVPDVPSANTVAIRVRYANIPRASGVTCL